MQSRAVSYESNTSLTSSAATATSKAAVEDALSSELAFESHSIESSTTGTTQTTAVRAHSPYSHLDYEVIFNKHLLESVHIDQKNLASQKSGKWILLFMAFR